MSNEKEFDDVVNKLLTSSDYREIDEVQYDIERLKVIYNKEIERLEKEIDELDDFLCPLFLRDEYGNISCRTNQGKEIERLEKENEKLKLYNIAMKACIVGLDRQILRVEDADNSQTQQREIRKLCEFLNDERQTLKELGEVESE